MIFFVHKVCVLLKHLVASCFRGLLQKVDGSRIITMLFSLASHLVRSHTVQSKICSEAKWIKCLRMKLLYIIFNIL